ncbi:MAG: TIGR01212 family radical SAM protein [Bacteroidaceae bacterium]|nr:TIGR01212 family radical SAM protein [Bacteroidaceae bacterium]
METTYLYTDFSHFLKKFFDFKVQKISVNAGFTCPNRDGTVGWGGCTYCNNQTFNPDYCETHKTITQQIEEGKQFFARKYPDMKFLAYFQAYTNTYDQLDVLKAKYEEALAVDGVVGLVVGTRPDCVSDELLRYLKDLSARCFVLVEYGVESVSNETLLRINRGHTFEQAVDTIHRTAKIGLPVGAHFILGLPGESWDDIVRSASVISQLPLDTIKLHQLQIVRGTRMAREYQENPKDFTLFSADEYASLVVDFLEHLTTRIAVERFTSQSPAELLMAPNWGLKNYQFVELVKKKLRLRSSYQGKESGAKNLARY